MGKRRVVLAAIGIVLVVASALVLTRTARRDEQAARVRSGRAASSLSLERRDVRLRSHTSRAVPVDHLPPEARRVAIRYALSAFTSTGGTPSDGWVRTVAPICTPAWLRHLDAATNDASLEVVTDHPRVIQVFASRAPAGGVGATVLLVDARSGGYDAIYIDLVRTDGRFLVRATQ